MSLFLCCRRYVKHSQSPNSESRASASATFASCSQAPECSTSSSLNASLGGCGSPLSDGASRSASSSNGSNHSGTCNETNGLYDGKQQHDLSPNLNVWKGNTDQRVVTHQNIFILMSTRHTLKYSHPAKKNLKTHFKIMICICLGEEEAMDHQVSPEPENGHSEEEEETSDLENGSKGDMTKLCSSPAKLFTFSIVNSYGTANISPLPYDGNVLQLNRKHSSFRLCVYI